MLEMTLVCVKGCQCVAELQPQEHAELHAVFKANFDGAAQF